MRVILQQHERDQEYVVPDVIVQQCELFRGLREGGVQEPVPLSCDADSFEQWLAGTEDRWLVLEEALRGVKVRCYISSRRAPGRVHSCTACQWSTQSARSWAQVQKLRCREPARCTANMNARSIGSVRGVDILSMQHARRQYSAWHLQTWSTVAASVHVTAVTFSVAVASTHVHMCVICWLTRSVHQLDLIIVLQVADYVADDALGEWAEAFWKISFGLPGDKQVVQDTLQLMLQQHDHVQHKLAHLHPQVQRVQYSDLPEVVSELPHPLLIAHACANCHRRPLASWQSTFCSAAAKACASICQTQPRAAQ